MQAPRTTICQCTTSSNSAACGCGGPPGLDDLQEPLWDDRRVSEFLGISRKTVQNWRIVHCGPEWCKIGHSARYRPAAVREYIARQSRASTSQAV